MPLKLSKNIKLDMDTYNAVAALAETMCRLTGSNFWSKAKTIRFMCVNASKLATGDEVDLSFVWESMFSEVDEHRKHSKLEVDRELCETFDNLV